MQKEWPAQKPTFQCHVLVLWQNKKNFFFFCTIWLWFLDCFLSSFLPQHFIYQLFYPMTLCVICKKVCRNIAFITAFFSTCPQQWHLPKWLVDFRLSLVARHGSSRISWISNRKSRKKIDWYSPRTESKISSPWARFTYLKKTIPHFLLLIEDGSEGAAIWLFPCWIVQSSHAQSHQNEVHFNLKRLFSICLKELYVETGWNEYSAL